jgi:hypothetical protein
MNLLKHITKQAVIICKRLFKSNFFKISCGVGLSVTAINTLWDIQNTSDLFIFKILKTFLILLQIMISIHTLELYGNTEFELITKLLYIKIDEEGRGYLSDLRSEWINAGLNPNQIKIKELIFILDHYRGKFIAWIQLPRILSLIKIK